MLWNVTGSNGQTDRDRLVNSQGRQLGTFKVSAHGYMPALQTDLGTTSHKPGAGDIPGCPESAFIFLNNGEI